MKKIFILLISINLLISCNKDKSNDCQNDPSARSGARCKDGTSSNATGSGACSSHGGVDVWICK